MSSSPADYTLDPRFIAGIEFLRSRTRMSEFQIRWQDDKQPTAWIAIGRWAGNNWDAAGAIDPVRAVLRLCEQVTDGAPCRKCGLPSAFDPDAIGVGPFDNLACWWQFDPELNVFRRGCD